MIHNTYLWLTFEIRTNRKLRRFLGYCMCLGLALVFVAVLAALAYALMWSPSHTNDYYFNRSGL